MPAWNATSYFDQDEWDTGGGPFTAETLIELGLEDITNSKPEFIDACSTGDILGFYRDAARTLRRADFEAGDEVWLSTI